MSSRFVGDKEGISFPQCHRCKHYIEGLKCRAFDQIPMEIYSNRRTHQAPYPDDNGIQFEAIEQREQGLLPKATFPFSAVSGYGADGNSKPIDPNWGTNDA